MNHMTPIALVTGGSKGIGLAIVNALHRDGMQVVVTARSVPPSPFLSISADATDKDAADCVIGKVIAEYGRLDVLVNNVGGAGKFGGFEDLNDVDWTDTFDLNVLSTVRFVRAAEPYLRQSGRGRIINIASISGAQPGGFNPHYCAAKAAQINLGQYLARYFANSGVLVNTVCPGPVHSDSWDKNVQRIASERGVPYKNAWQQVEVEESAKVPLGRIGEGRDVAELVAFLASTKASWITGSCFHVNGGKALYSTHP